MSAKLFVLSHAEARRRALAAVAEAPDGHSVRISEPKRSLDQNAAQWPYLDAFSKQLKWPVNGKSVRLEPDEWKDILTAAFKGETVRLAQGLDGGLVMLGVRTSRMSKAKFSEWLEFLIATAELRGVKVYYRELTQHYEETVRLQT